MNQCEAYVPVWFYNWSNMGGRVIFVAYLTLKSKVCIIKQLKQLKKNTIKGMYYYYNMTNIVSGRTRKVRKNFIKIPVNIINSNSRLKYFYFSSKHDATVSIYANKILIIYLWPSS